MYSLDNICEVVENALESALSNGSIALKSGEPGATAACSTAGAVSSEFSGAHNPLQAPPSDKLQVVFNPYLSGSSIRLSHDNHKAEQYSIRCGNKVNAVSMRGFSTGIHSWIIVFNKGSIALQSRDAVICAVAGVCDDRFISPDTATEPFFGGPSFWWN